jgi:hypothetical protein
MIEFVLSLPLLGTIVAVTAFFGWAMMHKHQVTVADRYASWHRVEAGQWPSEAHVDHVSFNDRASSVDIGGGRRVTETGLELVDKAGEQGGRPEALAEEVVLNRFQQSHGGRTVRLSARFSHDMEIFAKTSGPISHRHGREGHTWRCREVRCWQSLRDVFYNDMDARLEAVAPPADKMAQMIRGLYLAHWPDKTDEWQGQ